MATATKDMCVASLVEPWKGDSNSVPVTEFFVSINEAAEMGRLSAKDKMRLARLKLRGAARMFYVSQPELRADDISYADFRAAFVNRFKDKHIDQYYYARLQNASQEKNESPEVFLDRLRKLCQQTIRSSDNPLEQGIINQEADKRLLAAFVNGLIGAIPPSDLRSLSLYYYAVSPTDKNTKHAQMPYTCGHILRNNTNSTNANQREE